MNKNYLIIGLIVIALVVIGVIASRPGGEADFENFEGNLGRTNQDENTPTIEVSEQVLSNNQIVIDRVFSETDGWVVIHRVDSAGSPIIETSIGHAHVTAGNNQAVVITLDEEVENGDMLAAMLYHDTGVIGEFEPNVDSETDAFVVVDNEKLVAEFFTVIIAEDDNEEEVVETEESTESTDDASEEESTE